jgi:hypothetical protein
MKVEISVTTWQKACDRIRARFPRGQGSVTSMMLKKEYNILSEDYMYESSVNYPSVSAILVEFGSETDCTFFLLKFA